MSADAVVTAGGEDLVLCAERAVYWPARRTLLVADTHFGKSATFRSEGVPVPHGTTSHSLDRLTALLTRHDVSRLIVLGDFLHAAQGRTARTMDQLLAWRARHEVVEMVLVRGNHDRHAGDPPAVMRVECVRDPLLEPPFAFAHRPRSHGGSYTMAGHIHPAAALIGSGRQRLRLPCFWFGADVAVLPAFGDFTGLAEINALPGDRVFVIAQDAVIPVS